MGLGDDNDLPFFCQGFCDLFGICFAFNTKLENCFLVCGQVEHVQTYNVINVTPHSCGHPSFFLLPLLFLPDQSSIFQSYRFFPSCFYVFAHETNNVWEFWVLSHEEIKRLGSLLGRTYYIVIFGSSTSNIVMVPVSDILKTAK